MGFLIWHIVAVGLAEFYFPLQGQALIRCLIYDSRHTASIPFKNYQLDGFTMKIILVYLFFLISASSLIAQEAMLTDTNAVKSIGGIVKEFLRLQSGDKGKTKIGMLCEAYSYPQQL